MRYLEMDAARSKADAGRGQPTGRSSVTWSEGEVRLRDARVFGLDVADPTPCARFLGRILALDDVCGVAVDRDEATAILSITPGDPAGFLAKLAGAIRGEGAAGSTPGWSIPAARWERGTRFTVSRHGGFYSMWGVVYDRPGRLRLRHEALALNPDLGRRVAKEIATGSCKASASAWTGSLAIDYDPTRLSASELIRLAEEALERVSVETSFAAGADPVGCAVRTDSSPATVRTAHPTPARPDAPLGAGLPTPPKRDGETIPPARLENTPPTGPSENLELAGTVLGVAALGQFAVPALMPVSAVLLVGTNLRTFSAAWQQSRERKLGLPALSTTIVATTLASGQFVGAALMSCFTAYWNRRGRRDLAERTQIVLDECLPASSLVRLLDGPAGVGMETGEAEILVSPDRLREGHRIAVAPGDAIPADGRIVDGSLVVDERSLLGLDGASRKGPGDLVLAGSTVLAGSAKVVVERTGEATRAASIARALASGLAPVRARSAPTRFAEDFATRRVGPVLAASGAGFLLTGSPTTALAMMRPDYATGLGLSVPMATHRDIARCARQGIVIRDPEAFDKLDRVDAILLDDHPALHRSALEVAGIETRMPAEVEPELLRYAASALRHLDDDRAIALATACREREVPLLDLEPAEIAGHGVGVAIVHGRRRVRVHEADSEIEAAIEGAGVTNRSHSRSSAIDRASAAPRPLLVEIDGNLVALISFRESARPVAAEPIRRLAASRHVSIVLMTARPRAEVASLAASLGVNQVQGNLDPKAKAEFVRSYRLKGLKAAFVGDCSDSALTPAAAEAFVAVSLPKGKEPLAQGTTGKKAKTKRPSRAADLARIGGGTSAGRDELLPLAASGPASVQLLGDRLDRLGILWEIAAARSRRIRRDQAIVTVPNVAAAAGALLFGFTSFHSIVLTNLGTYTAYTLANDPPQPRGARAAPRGGERPQGVASIATNAPREGKP